MARMLPRSAAAIAQATTGISSQRMAYRGERRSCRTAQVAVPASFAFAALGDGPAPRTLA